MAGYTAFPIHLYPATSVISVMQRNFFLAMALAALLLGGCGGSDSGSEPIGGNTPLLAPGPALVPSKSPAQEPEVLGPNPIGPMPVDIPPTANAERALVATSLEVNATARTAVATITFAASPSVGATLEIGDLDIDAVRISTREVLWADRGNRLDLGLPPSETPITVAVYYRFSLHDSFDGASTAGFTFTWPYYCGNLFPCHSQPAKGVDLALDVRNAPAGQRVIQPTGTLVAAPSYQLAWAVGDYTDLDLGRTQAGTQLVASYLPGQKTQMQQGTVNLKAAFQWLETTLGTYRFGNQAGPVSVPWGAGNFGGMEHHPRWHVGAASIASPETQVHEAVHGWFGSGVRLACWEDFVLSEGTTSYLAARVLDVVAPEEGARTWSRYAAKLRSLSGNEPVWPQSCNQIDIMKDGLYTNAPYMRGAFFYQALAGKIGAPALDRVLARFYRTYAGRAAGMQDMLDTVQAEVGYDPGMCARMWLRAATIPVAGPCP